MNDRIIKTNFLLVITLVGIIYNFLRINHHIFIANARSVDIHSLEGLE